MNLENLAVVGVLAVMSIGASAVMVLVWLDHRRAKSLREYEARRAAERIQEMMRLATTTTDHLRSKYPLTPKRTPWKSAPPRAQGEDVPYPAPLHMQPQPAPPQPVSPLWDTNYAAPVPDDTPKYSGGGGSFDGGGSSGDWSGSSCTSSDSSSSSSSDSGSSCSSND